jgi:hypothetical protein
MGTDSIHPLVFRMLGDEPCIPLRLTSVAAEDDMGVRAYFLGQDRWVPLNYKHVLLNPLGFNWEDADTFVIGQDWYLKQLSAAVDVAGGQAFVTDYAGTSSDVDSEGLYSDAWDETAFIGVDPIAAIDLLIQQEIGGPLLLSVLMEFIPPPKGIDPSEFWSNIAQYADLIDLGAWDSVAFAAALSDRIIEPGMRALDLLETWPYLTRLHTLISAHEMTLDPVFAPTNDTDLVSNRLVVPGTDTCGDTGAVYDVPWNGMNVPVCLVEDGGWPTSFTEFPVSRIESYGLVGPPQVVEDFSPEIHATWQEHQIEVGCDPGTDETGGSEGTGGQGSEGTGDPGVNDGADKASCACSTGGRRGAGAPLGLAFGLFGVAFVRMASRTTTRARD